MKRTQQQRQVRAQVRLAVEGVETRAAQVQGAEQDQRRQEFLKERPSLQPSSRAEQPPSSRGPEHQEALLEVPGERLRAEEPSRQEGGEEAKRKVNSVSIRSKRQPAQDQQRQQQEHEPVLLPADANILHLGRNSRSQDHAGKLQGLDHLGSFPARPLRRLPKGSRLQGLSQPASPSEELRAGR